MQNMYYIGLDIHKADHISCCPVEECAQSDRWNLLLR